MKTKVLSAILGLFTIVQAVSAQNMTYRMHIRMHDGSTISVKTNEVEEVCFSASETFDPSHPVTADLQSIHAPQAGGTYIVHVNADIPLTTEHGPDGIAVDDFFNHFLNQAPVSLTTLYSEDGTLTITVHPATCRIVKSVDVKLYDLEGAEAFSLPVSQDGNPDAVLIGENGNAYVSVLTTTLATCHEKNRKADVNYTGLLSGDDFKAPLAPYDYRINDLWQSFFLLITRNALLMQHCDEDGFKMLRPMCAVLHAVPYYGLVTLFGGVPYYSGPLANDGTVNLPRTAPDEILDNLVALLTSVIDQMEEKVTGHVNSPEEMISLSKDIARVILADIYMYQGRYAEARPLLDAIAESNRYSLDSATDNLSPDSHEVIWSLPMSSATRARASEDIFFVSYNDCLGILQTYADVLLSLAECECKLGNDAKAKEYLNRVAAAKNIALTASETMAAVSELRQRIQTDFGGYFAFLKRTGQAQQVLGLEDYQLLFPIPQYEMETNPNMVQNPGYNGMTR